MVGLSDFLINPTIFKIFVDFIFLFLIIFAGFGSFQSTSAPWISNGISINTGPFLSVNDLETILSS